MMMWRTMNRGALGKLMAWLAGRRAAAAKGKGR